MKTRHTLIAIFMMTYSPALIASEATGSSAESKPSTSASSPSNPSVVTPSPVDPYARGSPITGTRGVYSGGLGTGR